MSVACIYCKWVLYLSLPHTRTNTHTQSVHPRAHITYVSDARVPSLHVCVCVCECSLLDELHRKFNDGELTGVDDFSLPVLCNACESIRSSSECMCPVVCGSVWSIHVSTIMTNVTYSGDNDMHLTDTRSTVTCPLHTWVGRCWPD